MITIPEQLRNKDFRFILVNSKKPIEEKWTTENNYEFDNVIIKSRCEKDESIGILGGSGRLLVIDSDTQELTDWIEQNLPQTFTVLSGSQISYKKHFYYVTQYPQVKTVLEILDEHRNVTHFGELQGAGAMVVAPNCLHSSGKRYIVIKDIKINFLSDTNLKSITEKFSNIKEVTLEEERKFKVRDYNTNDIEKQLNVSHIVPLVNMKQSRGEYFGAHPIHGSEGGANFWINPLKNTWHCFRCNSGGGVASLIAITEGLISCSQAIGKLDKEVYKAALNKAKEKYGYTEEKLKLSEEIKDEIDKLEFEINSESPNKLRRNIKDILIRVNTITESVIRSFFVNILSDKTRASKPELYKSLSKIKNSLEVKTVITLSELKKRPITEVKYLVHPLIPKNKLILLGGKPGEFKSMFALSLAMSMKENNMYLDKFYCSETPKVLYYDLENGLEDIKHRALYLENGTGYSTNDVTFVQNFNKENLEKEIEFAKDYDVIILDSYRRFLEGNENDSEYTDRLFKNYLIPLILLGKTIIIVHHYRKSNLEELDDKELMDIFRGSSDIPAQFDVIYGITKSEEREEKGIMTFDVAVLKVKNRLGIPIKTFNFTVTKDDVQKKTSFRFNSFKGLMSKTDEIRNKILEYIKVNGIADRKNIYEFIISQGKASSSAGHYLKEMVDNGLLVCPKYGKYTLPEYLNRENTENKKINERREKEVQNTIEYLSKDTKDAQSENDMQSESG